MRPTLVIAVAIPLIVGVVALDPPSPNTHQSKPTSAARQVEPVLYRHGETPPFDRGGSIDCGEVGILVSTAERNDTDPDHPGDDVTVLIGDGPEVVGTAVVTFHPETGRVDFTATIPIEAVVLSAAEGGDMNLYDYWPAGVVGDTGLGAPAEPDEPAEVRGLTLCSNQHEDPPASSWCSPMHWRQPQHATDWHATTIGADDPYLRHFSHTTLVRAAQGTNPTLLEILQAPQVFGGAAFNNVGDLLSTAHPAVHWSADSGRTEGSCPLD
jgi:hypothetical protein